MRIPYRPEIDGLRAVAVLPVVAFHAGLPGVSGGFIGVDVFFVISGFLITRTLFAEASVGHLSITSFYKRRLRRIAPALLAVLATSTVAALLLLLPSQLAMFAKSVIATETFSSNIWFWYGAGYFAAQGGILPLLHTWSLAVEEQFYLFTPLIVMACGRRRNLLFAIIVVVALVSFVGSIVGVSRMPSATFYLLPTRAWELLLGSVVALDVIPRVRSAIVREILGWTGLALIVASCHFLNEKIPFPGSAALPASLGAALFIWVASVSTFAGKLMARQPLVAVGKISYSLYLWHWPVLIYTRQYLGAELGTFSAICAVVVSLLAATATWKWIETPTRNVKIWSDRGLMIGSAAAALALGIIALFIIDTGGLPDRFSASVRLLETGANDYSPIAKRCGLSSAHMIETCRLGDADTSFILAGDSHAGGIAEAVDIAARKAKRGGILSAYNACPALINWQPTVGTLSDRQGCAERNQRLFERLRNDPRITTLIIANYWPPLARANSSLLRAAVQRTAAFAHRANKRLVVLHGVPEPGFDVPWSLAIAKMHGRPAPISAGRPSFALSAATGQFIDLGEVLCAETRCSTERHGRSLYVDGNHLSAYADRAVIAPFLIEKGILN